MYADELVAEVASYFYQSNLDGNYYLSEGYASLPQDLIKQLKEQAAMAKPPWYHVAFIAANGHVTFDKFHSKVTAERHAIRWADGQGNWAEIYQDSKLLATVRGGVVNGNV